jgi:hypothetical protein
MNEGQDEITSTQTEKEGKEKEKANLEQEMQNIQNEIDRLNAEDFDAQLEEKYTARKTQVSKELEKHNKESKELDNKLILKRAELATNRKKLEDKTFKGLERTSINQNV